MTPVNLKVEAEIISLEMASFLIDRQSSSGCNPQCLSCHFSERYLRELEPDSIETFLANDFQVTARPVQGGEKIVGWAGAHPIIIPNGIYWEVLQLHDSLADHQIAKYIYRRFKFPLKELHVRQIFSDFEDGLRADVNGVPMYPEVIEPPQHDGSLLSDLPTIPTTPRLGNPRSSFLMVPPNYSPRPTWNGMVFTHPREVVAVGGQVAPFYDQEQTPQPPSYASAIPFELPPAYVLAEPLADDEETPVLVPSQNTVRPQQTSPVVEEPEYIESPDETLPSQKDVIGYLNLSSQVRPWISLPEMPQNTDPTPAGTDEALLDFVARQLAMAESAVSDTDFGNPRAPPPLPSPVSSTASVNTQAVPAMTPARLFSSEQVQQAAQARVSLDRIVENLQRLVDDIAAAEAEVAESSQPTSPSAFRDPPPPPRAGSFFLESPEWAEVDWNQRRRQTDLLEPTSPRTFTVQAEQQGQRSPRLPTYVPTYGPYNSSNTKYVPSTRATPPMSSPEYQPMIPTYRPASLMDGHLLGAPALPEQTDEDSTMSGALGPGDASPPSRSQSTGTAAALEDLMESLRQQQRRMSELRLEYDEARANVTATIERYNALDSVPYQSPTALELPSAHLDTISSLGYDARFLQSEAGFLQNNFPEFVSWASQGFIRGMQERLRVIEARFDRLNASRRRARDRGRRWMGGLSF